MKLTMTIHITVISQQLHFCYHENKLDFGRQKTQGNYIFEYNTQYVYPACMTIYLERKINLSFT